MSDEDVAEGIATWLREKSAGSRTWYEVRTLLHDFEIDRFTSDAQDRITSALAAVGVVVEPELRTRERRDTVFLSWASSAAAPAPTPTPVRDAVTVRAAGADGIRLIPYDEAANSGSGVLWFDVRQPKALDPDDVAAALASRCPGVTAQMLADLLSPDPRPKTVRYGNGDIRSLSSFQVNAVESDDGAEPDSRSKAGILIFEPVEILVGSGWLLTCWHETQKFRGAYRIEELPPASSADIYAAVEHSWNSTYSTAGDLAVLLLFQLAKTYKPACRQLRVWEEEWELDYFRTDHTYEDTLVDTQASLAVLRDWLSPLNVSGMRQDVDVAWFPALSGDASAGGYERALRVDDRVDQSLEELAKVNTLVREAYELLEVRRVSKAQDRDARFQRTIAIGGSAILIPTLVAGVMGMNVWVPGEYGPTSAKWAFLVLIIVMIITALAAWYALKRMHDGDIQSREAGGSQAGRGRA